MRTCPRLAPVLLIALLGTIGPGGRMPGSSTRGGTFRTVDCPDQECGGKGRWQEEGFVFRCRKCRYYFNYCPECQRYLPDVGAERHRCNLRG